MAILYERDKLVHSIARFAAGLRSRYFTKYRRYCAKVYSLFIDGKTCPFCGKRFRKSGLVFHIVKKHYDDVIDYIGVRKI